MSMTVPEARKPNEGRNSASPDKAKEDGVSCESTDPRKALDSDVPAWLVAVGGIYCSGGVCLFFAV